MKRDVRSYLVPIVGLMVSVLSAVAQEHPNSPVLRSYVPPATPSLVKHFNEDERIWEDFMLVKKANEGDPPAQHELGLRYFFGQGFLVDTQKAAYWIRRAAEQNLAPARYNYGIMQNNGWGVDWNPFAAYLNFLAAARQGIPDAQYAVGTFLTDNLVVPRDEHEAYCWVQAAADSGYKPAIELLAEFSAKGYGTGTDSRSSAAGSDSAGSAFGLVYIDFSADTVHRPSDTTLIDDLKENAGERGKNLALPASSTDSESGADSALTATLRSMAEVGSPEALALLGRRKDKAGHGPADRLSAASEYLQAVRLGSPHAAQLLWELVHRPGFFEALKKEVDRGNPQAEFVWAGLTAYSFDQQLTEQQALKILKNAVAKGNMQAIIELGICYASGRWVEKDADEAVKLWTRARTLGSPESGIRILVARVTRGKPGRIAARDMASLRQSAEDGSILAEAALAYCYEKGIGVRQDIGEAVRLYRQSARRGSRAAFDELKRLYDDLRPHDQAFNIED